MAQNKKPPSWGPQRVRLDPETDQLVVARLHQIEVSTGVQVGYQDVVRALVRRGLLEVSRG